MQRPIVQFEGASYRAVEQGGCTGCAMLPAASPQCLGFVRNLMALKIEPCYACGSFRSVVWVKHTGHFEIELHEDEGG